MLSLIRIENMKIYRRIRTWILIGLIVLLPAAASLIMHNVMAHSQKPDWRADTQQQIEARKQALTFSTGNTSFDEQNKKEIAVDEYRLQHNVSPSDEGVWSYVSAMSNAIVLASIFSIIVASDIVAGEFSTGTIKLLLIRPKSRSKILLAKYAALLLFALLLLVLLFLTSFLMGGILTGFAGLRTPYVYAGNDLSVHTGSMLLHFLGVYGLSSVELLMVVTMAFMISTVFRSTPLAIGVPLLTMLIGNKFVLLLSKYEWVKYYLFVNTDLNQYLEGHPLLEGMTLSFSIGVLAVYFVIFTGLSWLVFNKRDVAA